MNEYIISIFTNIRFWSFVLVAFSTLIVINFSVVYILKSKQLGSFKANNDKEKINEKPWLDGIIRILNKIFSNDQKEVSKKFIMAGFYNNKSSQYFMPMKYTLLIFGIIVIVIMSFQFNWTINSSVVIGCIWLVLAMIGPDSYLAARANALRRALSDNLPYLLDLMSVCVQTGMTIEASMIYLAREMKGFDKDLSYMLERVNERARLVGLDRALTELEVRIPTNEVKSFSMTLKQSLQHGTSIYSVLATLSTDIREVRLLEIEEKVGKLSAKMSIPLILFVMLPIVILIAAPGVMRMLYA